MNDKLSNCPGVQQAQPLLPRSDFLPWLLWTNTLIKEIRDICSELQAYQVKQTSSSCNPTKISKNLNINKPVTYSNSSGRVSTSVEDVENEINYTHNSTNPCLEEPDILSIPGHYEYPGEPPPFPNPMCSPNSPSPPPGLSPSSLTPSIAIVAECQGWGPDGSVVGHQREDNRGIEKIGMRKKGWRRKGWRRKG